jgi:Uma2 family endonuclease
MSQFNGIPTLVVEILSPSTRDHDLTKKKTWYMENQVPEIFYMDLEGEIATFFFLTANGTYEQESASTGVIASRIFEGLEFPVGDLLNI